MTISHRRAFSQSLLLITTVALSVAARQLPSGPTPAAHLPPGSAQVEAPILVTFNFSVWDKQSRPIRDLDPHRLHISIAGREQAIDSLVPVPGRPISVIFLEDQSGSRFDQVGRKKAYFEMPATSRFLQSLASGGNSVAVASFAQGIKIFGPMQGGFSHDPNDIDSELRSLLQEVPRGPTALFDAVSWASKQLGSQPGFRAVVLVSDGMENSSHETLDGMVAAAQASKLSVFFLDTIDAEKNETNKRSIRDSERDLSEAASRIGGETFRLSDARDADLDFAKIAADITFSYSVSFRFESLKPVTELRNLKVKVDGDGVQVLGPSGTYALPR
jgi:VWFA-related protein